MNDKIEAMAQFETDFKKRNLWNTQLLYSLYDFNKFVTEVGVKLYKDEDGSIVKGISLSKSFS